MRDRLRNARDRLGRLRPDPGDGGGGDTSESDTSNQQTDQQTDSSSDDPPDTSGPDGTLLPGTGGGSDDTGDTSSSDDSSDSSSGPTRRPDRRGGRDRIGGGSDGSNSSASSDSDTSDASDPPGGPGGVGGPPPSTETTDSTDSSNSSDNTGLLGDAVDTASDAADAVGDAANDAVDAGREAAETAGEVVDDAGETVNETADSVGQDLQDAGAAAAEPIADATNDNIVGETVEDFVVDGSQIPGEAVASAPETVATAGDVLADAAKGAGASVSLGDPNTTPTDDSQAAFDRNTERANAAVDATVDTAETVQENPSEIGGVAAEAAFGVATGSAISRGARTIADADVDGLTRGANQAGLDTRGRSVTNNLQDRLSNVDPDLREAGKRAGEVLRSEDRGQGSPSDILPSSRTDTTDRDSGSSGGSGSPSGGDSGAVVDLDELEEQVEVDLDADGPADPVDESGAVIDARALRDRDDDDETTTAAPETDPTGDGRPAATTLDSDRDTLVGGLSPTQSGVAGAAGAAAGIDETTTIDPFEGSTFGPQSGALDGVDAVTDTTVTDDPDRVDALDGFAATTPLGTGSEPAATTPRAEDTPITELRTDQPTGTPTDDDLFTDTETTTTVTDDVFTGLDDQTTSTAITPTQTTTPTETTTPTTTTPTQTTPTDTPTQTTPTDTPTDTTPTDTPTGGGPTAGPPSLIGGPPTGGGGGRPRPPEDDPPEDDGPMADFPDFGLTGDAEQEFQFEGFDGPLFANDN